MFIVLRRGRVSAKCRPLAEGGIANEGAEVRRLSCVDNGFPRLSHGAALGVIADLGIGAVDLCVTLGGPHVRAEAVAVRPKTVADEVRRRIEGVGLEVTDVFLILGLDELAVNHPDLSVRQESQSYFRAAVRFALEVGAPGITLLPGVAFEGVSVGEGMDLAAAELGRRAAEAGDEGIRISVEPHVGSLIETPAAALDLLDRVPDLSLTLDHSHFLYQGMDQRDVAPLVPRTRHVQIRQASRGRMQMRAREGSLDLEELRGQLNDGGFDGVVAIEYLWDEWMDCDQLDCVSETAELRDLLRQHGVVGST